MSGPGWSSMLTGVWLDKHGVPITSSPPRLQEVPSFLSAARADEAKSIRRVHLRPLGADQRTHRHASRRGLLAQDRSAGRRRGRGSLSGSDPDAVFIHFDHVDHAGHNHGFHPSVVEYMKAIEETDGHVGRIIKAVHGRKTYAREDWLILVSTDHGGSDKGHGKNIPEHRTIFVIVSGPSAGHGGIEPAPNVVDVGVTALVHLGVAIDAKWNLDGKAVGLRASRAGRNSTASCRTEDETDKSVNYLTLSARIQP